ncbi:uncharacterized protein HD556DRAFT_1312282 [Suillus plorans]|uniref:Uncharacterized protein n=1 Tax=Suillus plorans TaxID=116603 RepID=A0A9P7AGT2_9AGAM|nr:uncharacterized protein HD556DRAFT_1312282 [Suillus plorans]KAG1787993.1 hypothetical protein HD556DRAFT_1312282 [Suillus plorans]
MGALHDNMSKHVTKVRCFPAVFTPNNEIKHHIEIQSAQKTQASMKVLAPSTATTSTSAVPPHKSKKRKASPNPVTSMSNPTLLFNPALITEFRKILALLQNEMVEIWGENETMRKTHTKDIKALRKVTMLIVPLHLCVLLNLVYKKVLGHLSHKT